MKLFKDLFNTRYILAGNRLAWIDYIRGICIILVCYRHCFDGLKEAHLPVSDFPLLVVLNVCFYSFRMPLFFIVSGLFVSRGLEKKGLAEYIQSRFKIVFYPLIIWGSLQITLQLIFRNYINAKPSPFDYVNLIIFPRNPSNNQQFWYLNALFFVGVLYALFKISFRFKSWQQLILSLLLYGVADFLNARGISFYIFTDIFHYYIYFFIGDMLAGFIFKKDASEKILSPLWLITSAIIFLTLQTIFTYVNLLHKDDNYINLNLNWVLLPISLSGCAFMIQIGQLLQKKNILRWLRVIGYHSLFIYLMHLMLIAAVRVVMVKMLHITYIPLIMLIAISLGISIPIIIYNLCVRLHAWWLFSLKKPEGEIQYYTSIKTA